MGHIRHNAIVVTTFDEIAIQEAVTVARHIRLQVLGPSVEVLNGFYSLLICPSGSAIGWHDSIVDLDKRGRFKGWLNHQRHGDGSSALEWVEIAYGDDKTVEVVAHAWSAVETL